MNGVDVVGGELPPEKGVIAGERFKVTPTEGGAVQTDWWEGISFYFVYNYSNGEEVAQISENTYQ